MAAVGLFTSGATGAAPLPTAQELADRIQARARAAMPRPLFRPPPLAPLPPTDDLIAARLAEELAYMRRILDAVGERMVADPHVATRHGSTMQQFDVIGQMLGHIASVIGTSARGEAIDRIGMANLKARLQR